MGKGAFLTFKNKTEENRFLKIKEAGKDCMNNTGIWPSSIPYNESSERQYIEAKSSLGCASRASIVGYEFSISNESEGEGTRIGNIVLLARMGLWSVEQSDVNITLKITRGEQDTILIDVSMPNESGG